MKLLNKVRSIGRKGKLALAITTLAVGVIAALPAVHAEFYPNRPTYDYNKFDPSNNNCDDPSNPATQNGRCGSMNGPVFNSFVNTPSYGDERPFFDGRFTDAATGSTSDPVQNVDQDAGKEVTLRVYVHNNANQGTDCLPEHLDANGNCTQIDNNAVGIAHNAKVSITLPTATAQVLRARADISASNATEVEDTVDMTGGEPFTVSYVPGSAVLLRNNVSYPLSDGIVNGGALIGNTVMDGNLPGCFNYAALVEIKVKINTAPTPNLQVVKQVKVKGAASWSKNVDAKVGDDVQWRIGTKDISNANLNNVVARDVLPPHLKVVPGSVQLIDPTSQHTLADSPLFAGGFNIGNYVPGSTQYIIFDTIAQDDFAGCSVTLRNQAFAKSDQTPSEVTDTSDVTITKQNCNNQPQTPTYSCDLLTVTPGDNRTATFTTTASAAGGAQITLYKYDFGDGTPVFMTNKASVSHAYAKDGQYAARVTVQVNANNKVELATSDKCAALVNFTTPPPTTPGTPGTINTASSPTTLVNTGPGSVAGLFLAVTGIGTLIYRRMLTRRLSR
jgi:uncharacterized repeat protein (TIGR01451 family)